MVSSRPQAILEDRPVDIEPPALGREEKRSFWSRWRSRA
jgi:hypothetical protein